MKLFRAHRRLKAFAKGKNRVRSLAMENLEARELFAGLVYHTAVDATGSRPFAVFNTETNTWKALSPISNTGSLAASSNGDLYMVNQTTGQLQQYNTVSDTWLNIMSTPFAGKRYGELEVSKSGQFYYWTQTYGGSDARLYYTTSPGNWSSIQLPSALSAGDYDPATDSLYIARAWSSDMYRVDATSKAVTTYNVGSVTPSEQRRYGEALNGKWYSSGWTGSPTYSFDIANPAAALTTYQLNPQYAWPSGAADESAGIMYLQEFGSRRFGYWNPVTNIVTQLPQALNHLGHTTIAFVSATNSVPSANDDAYVVEEDGALSVAAAVGVLTNDVDGDGDSLMAVLANGPTNGALSLNPDGSFTYTPNADFNGLDSFTYEVSDGNGGLDMATVKITVNSVNDAPNFIAGSDQTIDEDAAPQTVSWATGISAGPANESAQTVGFSVSNDNNSLFSDQPTIASDGTLTYTPAPNAYGVAVVTVLAFDDGGTTNGGVDTSAPTTFVITVNSVIDAVIDVKPGNGNQVDPIHLASKGVTPIAILSTQKTAGEIDDLDAATLDVALMSFKINDQVISPMRATLEDVDGDGDLDLLLHFLTEDLAKILTADDTELSLTAEFDGPAIGSDLGGSDAIRVVPKKHAS